MPALSTVKSFASLADVAACRAMLRQGSRTFFAASMVLPKRVRTPATGLYAFCRMADDAIDRGTDSAGALADLRARLDGIYSGMPRDVAADRAFADVVTRHAIPQSFPRALLEGFEWDALNRRYEDLAQLSAYAVRVAGTVGAMMALVMGVRGRSLVARACDLGVAMQLTNIARDVGEDAALGRLYLPLSWMRSAGLDPEAWVRNPVFDERLKSVVQQLLAAADVLYRRADAGIARLPAVCKPGMFAARLLYAAIGDELGRRGHDSVNSRAVVPWQRKAKLLADAMLSSRRSPRAISFEVLDEALFLLDGLHDGEESVRGRMSRASVEDRVVWVMDLFERLERRERAT